MIIIISISIMKDDGNGDDVGKDDEDSSSFFIYDAYINKFIFRRFVFFLFLSLFLSFLSLQQKLHDLVARNCCVYICNVYMYNFK